MRYGTQCPPKDKMLRALSARPKIKIFISSVYIPLWTIFKKWVSHEESSVELRTPLAPSPVGLCNTRTWSLYSSDKEPWFSLHFQYKQTKINELANQYDVINLQFCWQESVQFPFADYRLHTCTLRKWHTDLTKRTNLLLLLSFVGVALWTIRIAEFFRRVCRSWPCQLGCCLSTGI